MTFLIAACLHKGCERDKIDQLFQMARERLSHVYWLGGPGCSGKSSVARLLGRELDLRIYHVDEEMQYQELDWSLIQPRWRGYDLYGKNGTPLLHLSGNDAASCVIDRWKAIFIQTIRHLLTLPRDKDIFVEGVFLPESLLNVADSSRIAIMVSGREFREKYFDHRYEWFSAYEDKGSAFQTALDALDAMDQSWTIQAAQFKVCIFRMRSPQDIDDAVIQLVDQFVRGRG